MFLLDCINSTHLFDTGKFNRKVNIIRYYASRQSVQPYIFMWCAHFSSTNSIPDYYDKKRHYSNGWKIKMGIKIDMRNALMSAAMCTAIKWYIHASENNEIPYRNEYMRIAVAERLVSALARLSTLTHTGYSLTAMMLWKCPNVHIHTKHVIEVAISCLKAIIMV